MVSHRADERKQREDTLLLRSILGVDVTVFSKNGALTLMARLIAAKTHTKFCFLNAHNANIAWTDSEYRRDLKGFVVLADGIGVDFCSVINYGKKFPANLNGTDFIPTLLAHMEKGVSVGLLGGERGVAEVAAGRLKECYPAHNFTVVSHGFFSDEEKHQVLSDLADLKPDVLLVAMGNPAQEKWIAENCTSENCTLAFGIGAYFDFVAERVPRAPKIIRQLRLEWLFRLGLEPKRMWRRYVIGNPLFLLRSIMQKFGPSRGGDVL